MIITVGGIKGGAGKTTIATNFAIMRALEGRDVLLIDADDQETSTDFSNLRSQKRGGDACYTYNQLGGEAVRSQGLRMKEKYQDIVIDAGGRDTTSQRAALTISDILLLPFPPSSFDVWTIEKAEALVEEVRIINPNLQAYVFLNKAEASGDENAEASDYLRESEILTFIDTPIGNRKVFRKAASEGMAVVEYKPKNKDAISELETLFQRCYNVIITLKNRSPEAIGA